MLISDHIFMKDASKIRNIAIIAHVDHGKTTMVDGLLKQSRTFRDNQAEMSQELIMDSGDQEHERGITITAKQTSIFYGDYKINIIDTPGHADFSGEVERTLNMADGVLLIVDAQEGPMPQTKFVLAKALELGLKPVVIINKIDKPARRIAEVEDELSDLFLELATDDSQLQYPIYYAIGRDGKSWKEIPANTDEDADLTPIFDAIINDIPAPDVTEDGAFQLLVTSLQYDTFQGKYAIGRIARGSVKRGLQVSLMKNDEVAGSARIEKVFGYRGLNREELDEAFAGDIVALVGVADAHIGDTIADKEQPEALPTIDIEAPTLSMHLGPNTSPMKGREGEFTTSRQIGDRLKRELETNVALRVEENGIGFTISGRGELHLSVFIGAISQELGARHAEMKSQETTTAGAARLTYILPTRALIGLRNILLTATRGTVIMNSLPHGYQPLGGKLPKTRNGVLIAFEAGTTTPYALQAAEARGELLVGPGTEVYAGMIVGIYNRQEDIEINVCKAKHLTNMRSKSSDGTVQLTPFTQFSLEQCIDFIEDDELLEVTPKSLRLRKRYLDANERKRAAKQ